MVVLPQRFASTRCQPMRLRRFGWYCVTAVISSTDNLK